MILQRAGPKNHPLLMSPSRVKGMQKRESRMLETQRFMRRRLKGIRRNFSDSRITTIMAVLKRKPDMIRMVKTIMMMPSVTWSKMDPLKKSSMINFSSGDRLLLLYSDSMLLLLTTLVLLPLLLMSPMRSRLLAGRLVLMSADPGEKVHVTDGIDDGDMLLSLLLIRRMEETSDARQRREGNDGATEKEEDRDGKELIEELSKRSREGERKKE